ncbi:DNA polymerase IV [Egibacter rhizosphaerae]|uniref:DNA polymerase IV n=1 Tax=Egibacter rhizosphaerae TaxID=1670831 RepID=A0A411YAB6_9ACTN|nr:DNA polymerase IV [Egibacter rhizosphaerae]QBI18146.1 DNA polymerase IV [Egibacter rhizosphaerae]
MTGQRPPEPILHLDMDAFYASVEALREPSLAGKPLLIGGTGGRGVVASASYEARVYGIRSAMPMASALRRCPHAIVRPPDFAAYTDVSHRLMELLRSVTPLVEPLSLDEAFLDVGGSVRLFGEPPRIAADLRERIADELQLPASVGVAPNKFLAKLCSEHAKPDGLKHLPVDGVTAFLAGLEVRELWGVGEKTTEQLHRYGLRTVGDIAATEPATLARIVGQAAGAHLSEIARGHDPRTVTPDEAAKGLSAEETFETDVDDPEILRTELLRLAEKVAQRLRGGGVAGRTVTLKLRFANFQTLTRSRTLPTPTDQATVLHREATALLEAQRLERVRVRLVGLGVGNLVDGGAAQQLDLLESDRWETLEHAADDARARFGDTAVTRGALLARDPRAGPGPDEGWPTRDDTRGG